MAQRKSRLMSMSFVSAKLSRPAESIGISKASRLPDRGVFSSDADFVSVESAVKGYPQIVTDGDPLSYVSDFPAAESMIDVSDTAFGYLVANRPSSFMDVHVDVKELILHRLEPKTRYAVLRRDETPKSRDMPFIASPTLREEDSVIEQPVSSYIGEWVANAGDNALITLQSEDGNVAEGKYPQEKLTASGIGLRDRFQAHLYRVDSERTELRFERISPTVLTPEERQERLQRLQEEMGTQQDREDYIRHVLGEASGDLDPAALAGSDAKPAR
jgi:hypothetical protein